MNQTTPKIKNLQGEWVVPKVGDAVETCDLMPGFITGFDSNGDDIEIYQPYYKNNKTCSLKHCGLVAISKSYLEKLNTIGPDNLKKFFDKSNGDQELYRKEIDDFSASS